MRCAAIDLVRIKGPLLGHGRDRQQIDRHQGLAVLSAEQNRIVRHALALDRDGNIPRRSKDAVNRIVGPFRVNTGKRALLRGCFNQLAALLETLGQFRIRL